LFYWCVATNRTPALDVFPVFAIRLHRQPSGWGGGGSGDSPNTLLNVSECTTMQCIGTTRPGSRSQEQNCRCMSSNVRLRMMVTKVARDPREGLADPSLGPWTHQSAFTHHLHALSLVFHAYSLFVLSFFLCTFTFYLLSLDKIK